MNNIFGEILSFAGDLLCGTVKSIAELVTGKDLITHEPLGYIGVACNIIGAIPILGAFLKVKNIRRCAKFAKGIIKVIRASKKPNEYITAWKKGKLIGKIYGNIIVETALAVKGFTQSICEIADYIRYDDGLVAAAIRTIDKAACSVAAPVINATQEVARNTYYYGGRLLGKSDEEMQQSLDKIDDTFSTKYDQIIDKLSTINYSGRFFGDIALSFSHVIAYANITSLSDEGLARIQGFNDEAARRYNQNKNKNNNISPDNPKWDEMNKQRAKSNRALDKAKRDAMKDDIRKNRDKEKNRISTIFPIAGGWILGKLFDYFWRLIKNSFWLMGRDFKNYWKEKFGGGGYGFHTCPYGCGRPIPDAFKGCTELLQAFPDYFN